MSTDRPKRYGEANGGGANVSRLMTHRTRIEAGEFEAAGSARQEPFARAGGASGSTSGFSDDEERMPVSSAWAEQPRQRQATGWVVRQVKAAMTGLVLGLALVLPTVFWLTGHFSDDAAPVTGKPTTEQGLPPEQAPRPARAHASAISPTITPSIDEAQKAALEAANVRKAAADAAEALLVRAQNFLADGNMVRARQILGDASLAGNAKAAFVLAETYDPNILAATGAQGVRAEVERARTLYTQALAGGIALAQQRLDALH